MEETLTVTQHFRNQQLHLKGPSTSCTHPTTFIYINNPNPRTILIMYRRFPKAYYVAPHWLSSLARLYILGPPNQNASTGCVQEVEGPFRCNC